MAIVHEDRVPLFMSYHNIDQMKQSYTHANHIYIYIYKPGCDTQFENYCHNNTVRCTIYPVCLNSSIYHVAVYTPANKL